MDKYVFSCRDVSGLTCDYRTTEPDTEASREQLMEHIQEEHYDVLGVGSEEERSILAGKMDELMSNPDISDKQQHD